VVAALLALPSPASATKEDLSTAEQPLFFDGAIGYPAGLPWGSNRSYYLGLAMARARVGFSFGNFGFGVAYHQFFAFNTVAGPPPSRVFAAATGVPVFISFSSSGSARTRVGVNFYLGPGGVKFDGIRGADMNVHAALETEVRTVLARGGNVLLVGGPAFQLGWLGGKPKVGSGGFTYFAAMLQMALEIDLY